VEWRGAPYDSYPTIKPINNKYVGDNEAKNAYGRAGRHRFGEYYNDTIIDPNILIQAAWDYLQTINGPLVSYEVDAIELERISGFNHEKVRMGDFVGIIDAEFTPALRVKARVLQINRNLTNPEKSKFVIGNYIPSVITRVG
jgi:phage minor structural protein